MLLLLRVHKAGECIYPTQFYAPIRYQPALTLVFLSLKSQTFAGQVQKGFLFLALACSDVITSRLSCL
jgi:hypothetical protein